MGQSAQPAATVAPISNADFFPANSTVSSPGKGGVNGQVPIQMPTQGQYAPLSPTADFNVNNAAAGALQKSIGATQNGLTYNPGQLATTSLAPYQNPFENSVVQQSLRDIGGAQAKSINQMDAQASAANAFGGSRHGIADAETRKIYGQQAADAVTGLRSQGFQNAQNAAQFDIGQQNIGNTARLNAANQLAGLGQQAFNTGQTISNAQGEQGALQQGLQQLLINAANGQFAGYTGAPNAALQAPLAALGVTPVPKTTTNSRQPGLFDYLSLGAGMIG